jgi:arsenate reductase (glutaredoxin)
MDLPCRANTDNLIQIRKLAAVRQTVKVVGLSRLSDNPNVSAPMSLTIYHNPRCSKSREALQLLRDAGQEPEVVEYLKTPPDAATLARLQQALGLPAREMARSNEPAWREAGLDTATTDDAAVLAAIARDPVLLQRPLVVRGARAVIGRPPERVLELLDQ